MDIGMIGCTGERWYVLFNASDYDIQFRLPPPGEGLEWIQTIDTATNDGLPFLPDDIKRQVAVGRAHSLKLLERVALPAVAVQLLGPQQAAWMPVSLTRSAGRLLIMTLGEPMMAGPIAGCGQAGQPWASAGT